VGWPVRVADVLRKIFGAGGAGKGINESDFDTGKAYLIFMQLLAGDKMGSPSGNSNKISLPIC